MAKRTPSCQKTTVLLITREFWLCKKAHVKPLSRLQGKNVSLGEFNQEGISSCRLPTVSMQKDGSGHICMACVDTHTATSQDRAEKHFWSFTIKWLDSCTGSKSGSVIRPFTNTAPQREQLDKMQIGPFLFHQSLYWNGNLRCLSRIPYS